MLLPAVPEFAGCQHGANCKRCLAVAVMQQVLNISPTDQQLHIPQEPALQRVSQLDDDQMFAVAVALLVATCYFQARAAGQNPPTPHLSLHATAGSGKSTVLNVVR